MSESQDGAPGISRWRRPSTWILLVVGALALWFLGSLALTGWHAKQANAALQSMTDQIAAGDPQAAAASIEKARSNTQKVQAAVTSLPVSALNVVPYFHTNLTGANTFMDAAQEVLDAAAVTNDVYARLSGSDGSGQAAFADGTINIAALQGIEPQIAQMNDNLSQADELLQTVPADVSPLLRGYVDEASDQVAGIQKGLRIYDLMLPELPTLLGEDSPATYLVVFHNPGELYAGGGAALNAALVEFDQGKMEVVDKGAVSSHFFPGNPSVPVGPGGQGALLRRDGRDRRLRVVEPAPGLPGDRRGHDPFLGGQRWAARGRRDLAGPGGAAGGGGGDRPDPVGALR